MEKITLYEEYRLVERNETEINSIWKGAHLLLFFLAFVFGSFCTFCFHMLMYIFDEKCVLFPKLLLLTSIRKNFIYEFLPDDKDGYALPVDFLNTQWVDKSACYLPTYVPLVSGIFGLVWTTMFLMCSTGSRVFTGLQRPWRVLPPVFLFSLAMGSLCVYTSAVTHYGLQELCVKLSEITGSSTCTFTVNVASLAYERRIRGVYQATRLTIVSAWLHTFCWLLSALLAVVRVILAVDFQLVRIKAQLKGNVDRMLECYEEQIDTVLPDYGESSKTNQDNQSHSSVRVHFQNKDLRSHSPAINNIGVLQNRNVNGKLLYFSETAPQSSEMSLVPVELKRLERMAAYSLVAKKHRFIVKILYDMLDLLNLPESPPLTLSNSTSTPSFFDSKTTIVRQFGQQRITSIVRNSPPHKPPLASIEESKNIARGIMRQLQLKVNEKVNELELTKDPIPRNYETTSYVDLKNVNSGLESQRLNEQETPRTKRRKSNLKHVGVQTKSKTNRVHIDSRSSIHMSSSKETKKSNEDKETQTKKEKQD